MNAQEKCRESLDKSKEYLGKQQQNVDHHYFGCPRLGKPSTNLGKPRKNRRKHRCEWILNCFCLSFSLIHPGLQCTLRSNSDVWRFVGHAWPMFGGSWGHVWEAFERFVGGYVWNFFERCLGFGGRTQTIVRKPALKLKNHNHIKDNLHRTSIELL